VVKITQNRIIVSDSRQLDQLRDEFDRRHCVVLRQLLEPTLREQILQRIEKAQFYSNTHRDSRKRQFGFDLTLRENELVLHLVHFLLNDPALFEAITRITGCSAIGSFGGRIYRNLPGDDYQLEWHDDIDVKERLLGISINLSQGAYTGGVFQVREKHSGRITGEVTSNPGDAHMFRISTHLQHRLTPVSGETARTCAAGWFFSTPDCSTALKNLARPFQ
jgi:2OG-Fe(II) oxygenase superfamily